MDNTTSFSEPATPATEAALTLLPSSNDGEGQNLVNAISAQETPIQQVPAENPPTVVQATAIVPAGDAPLPAAMGLSQRQRFALQALASGAGPGAAARAAGVNPGTLFRWRKYDARFVAAFNAWKAESMKTAREYLVAANEQAARNILEAVRAGDVRTSLAVVRGMGTLTPQQVGPEFARLVENEQLPEHDRIKLFFGKQSSNMKAEEAMKRAREKREADAEAKKKAMQRAEWERFAGGYLQIPPLPRPTTSGEMNQAVAASAQLIRTYATRCSVAIVGVNEDDKLGYELLVNLLTEHSDFETTDETLERLKSLPWLLKVAHPFRDAEQYAKRLEGYGAKVELRPSWVE